MKNKKKNRIFLLLILLLGISIGFAALATTLKINGSASITKNNWNIYWDNIGNQEGVVPTTSEIVDEDTTHKNNIVNFEVTFNKPGDYYEFQVDAINAGTIDAEILKIEKKYNDIVIPSSGTSPLPSYLKYEVTYADDTAIGVGDKLLKRTDSTTFTRKRYKVRVEYDKDAVTNSDINKQVEDVTHTFSFKVVYGQSNQVASLWVLPQGKTKDTLAYGDEICVENECFNFMKYEGNDVIMLSKYNLNVGDYLQPGEVGLQNSLAIGSSTENSNSKLASVAFSNTRYWSGNSNYTLEVYDPENYSGAPDSNNYSIAYYVEAYKSILESYGATIKNARLLTYTELTDASTGCHLIDYTGECPTGSFIGNTTFWLGTLEETYSDIWYVIYGGSFYNSMPNIDQGIGVRPVIVIEKSNL